MLHDHYNEMWYNFDRCPIGPFYMPNTENKLGTFFHFYFMLILESVQAVTAKVYHNTIRESQETQSWP